MKNESVVVQFVDISPLTNESHFRLCAVSVELVSKPFTNLQAAVAHAEKESSEFQLIQNLGHQPWSIAMKGNVSRLTRKCELFKVVVWGRENGSLRADDYGAFAFAQPVRKDLQPELPFWVVDMESDLVIARVGEIDTARMEFRQLVATFESQF